MSRRRRRSWRQRLVLGLNVVVCASALVTAWALQGAQARAENLTRVELPGVLRAVDEQANAGDRILNFLIVGSDSAAGLDPDDPINNFRQGENFSDVIIIAHVDEAQGTLTLFSIPRDLWVPIADLDEPAKINSAFAWGGPARLIETIRINMGVEIDFYLNVNFAGFRDLVDVVGGVNVYFPAPARDWDAAYNITRTGFEVDSAGCEFLEPDRALAYVRSRHYQVLSPEGEWMEDVEGDLGRIERQQDFVQRLISEAISQGARNPFKLRELVDGSLESVTVDDQLTAQLLVDLATSLGGFEADELRSYAYPADIGTIERQSVVLGRDEEAEAILSVLRGVDESDPSTVFLKVAYQGELEDDVAELLENLSADGFLMAEPRFDLPAPGIEVSYGDDGRQAADLVVAALGDYGVQTSAVRLSRRDDIDGRTVRLAIGLPEYEAATPTTTIDDEAVATTVAATSESAPVPEESSPPHQC